jgi:hypothetical protein
MTDLTTTTDMPYTVRLAALDRAIDRLQANHEASPDDVVALAEKFEKYLTRSDA